jgi:dipeptidyl aminopeptidase/acylaminoacyl peptidase
MKKYKKRIINVIEAALGLYVGICIGMYFIQDKMLYHPVQNMSIEKARVMMPALQEITYESDKGQPLSGWFLKSARGKKVVVYLHGNAYNIGAFSNRLIPFAKNGYGILFAEYPGFGGVPGKISQANLEEAAVAAVQYLQGQGYQNRDIILYGYSLGTYLAVYTAARMGQNRPFDAVVLEAPFTSIVPMARQSTFYLFPVGLMMKDKYPSGQLIGKINTRVFIAHGKNDTTVPYSEGVALYTLAAQPKLFYSVDDGDHNNLRAYGMYETMIDWLQKSDFSRKGG